MLKYNIINSYYSYIKKDITKKEFKQHIKQYRNQLGGAADAEIEKNIKNFINYVQNLNLSDSSSQIKKSIDDLIKKLTNEIEQLKKQNQDNQSSLKEGQSKTGELQKKYNDTNTIKEQLENDLNTLNNFLKEKNKKYDDLQKTYDNLIDEKTRVEKQLKEQIKKLYDDLQKIYDNLMNEKTRVEEQLKEQIKEQTKISEIILDDSKKTSEKLNLANKTINSQNDKIKNLEFVRNLKDKIISEHEEKIYKYKELSSSLLEDSLKNLGEIQKISKRREIYTKYGLQGGWEAVFNNLDTITIYELPEVIFEARYNQFTTSLSAIAKEEIIDVTQLLEIYSKFLKQYEEDYNIIIDFINTFSKVKIERIKLDLPVLSSIKEYKIKKSEAINLLNILKSNQNILISIIKNIQKMLPK